MAHVSLLYYIEPMKLFGTNPSHFTRKVRILLQELQQPYEFVVLKQLMEVGSDKFGGNPLQMFPVLEDGATKLFESDIICEYLCDKYGKASPVNSFLPSAENKYADLKRMAVMNGVMASGVKLIRAMRSEIPNYLEFPFFRQEKAAISEGLEWLDKDLGNRTAYYSGRITMLDIGLMCAAEWVVFRNVISDLSFYPNIVRFVEANKTRPSFASTHPSKES